MARRKRSAALPALLSLVLGRRRRRRRPAAPAAGLAGLGAFAAFAGAIALVLRRRRGGGDAADLRTPPGSPPSEAPATKVVQQEWTCACGQLYRVSGEGRHRIYWLPDAPVSDPVTEGRCENCGRELPGDQPSDDQAAADQPSGPQAAGTDGATAGTP